MREAGSGRGRTACGGSACARAPADWATEGDFSRGGARRAARRAAGAHREGALVRAAGVPAAGIGMHRRLIRGLATADELGGDHGRRRFVLRLGQCAVDGFELGGQGQFRFPALQS